MLPVVLAVALVAPSRGPGPNWTAATKVIERGIDRRLFPGAVLVVGRSDTVLYSRGFGRLSWRAGEGRPDPAATLWDLASLTKVVATTSAAMALVDRGSLDLDAPVALYLPRFTGGGKERVTVRMLLNHTSGLPAYRPLHQLATTREGAIDRLYEVPLIALPGTRVDYSDLNAILLGLVVEHLSGVSLAEFAGSAIFRPLGMRRTVFAPEVADKTNVAPSIAHGGRPAPGEVNDRNAAVLGGVAGHAGLFATGLDLARFAQGILRAERLDDSSWIRPATMRQFLARSESAGTRALGWDTPDLTHLDRTAYGHHATESMFGHTGWTGTFLWFDPKRDLFLVFLTNRSLGSAGGRSLRAMRDLRSALSDAVTDLVGGAAPGRATPVGFTRGVSRTRLGGDAAGRIHGHR
jgi:CubicO group peptidase (beta-lactamase class C family)